MVIGVVGDGIANQLYDYFFTYLFCQRYGQEFCLLEVYDYARYDFYNTIYELDVPRVPVITFDTQYFPYKDDFVCQQLVEGTKKYFSSQSVTILTTEDFVLDGPWQLKDESVFEKYDYIILNPFVYSQLHILLDNKEALLPLWKLRPMAGTNKEALLAGITPHTVGVHVRGSQQIKAYGEAAATEYFRAAIQFYREKYEDAQFYIFSNEQEIAKRFIGQAQDIIYVQPDYRGVRGDFEELFLMSRCPHKIMSNGSTYSDLAVVMCDAKDWSYIQARTGAKELLKRKITRSLQPNRHYLINKDVTKLSQKYTYTELKAEEEDLQGAFLRFEQMIQNENYEEALCFLLKLRDEYSSRKPFHELCLKLYQGLGMKWDALVEEKWLENYSEAYEKTTQVRSVIDGEADCSRSSCMEKHRQPHFVVIESDHVYGESVDLVSALGHILHRMGYGVSSYFTDQDTSAGLYENARPEWRYRSQAYGGVECLYQELLPACENPLYQLLDKRFAASQEKGQKTVLLYRIGESLMTEAMRKDDRFVHIALENLNWYAPFAYGIGEKMGLEQVIKEPSLPMIQRAKEPWNLVTQSSFSEEYYSLALKILELSDVSR